MLKQPFFHRTIPWAAAFALLLTACSGEGASPANTASESAPPPPAPSIAAPTLPPTEGPSLSPSPAAPTPTPSATPEPSLQASPSVSPTVQASAKTTAAPVKPAPAAGASTKALSWYYMKKPKGQVPGFPPELKGLKPEQKAVWVGTGKKVYLTFDSGGPLGESDKLLQILKDNGVKATFFMVGYNVKQFPDFARKVTAAGHSIGNHTMTHKDLTTLSDAEVKEELEGFARLLKETTGQGPAPMFRFPYGKYSLHLLDEVSAMGYTSFFWSTAMRDWEPRAGGAEEPYRDILNGLHDGNIILMHQGSPENIEALDRIIKAVKQEGYEFGDLDELVL